MFSYDIISYYYYLSYDTVYYHIYWELWNTNSNSNSCKHLIFINLHCRSEMIFLCYTGNCLFFVRRSSTFRRHRGAARKFPLCQMSLAQLEIWPWHWTFEATQETWSEFCCLPCDCQRRRKTDDWLWPIWPEVFFCGFIILSAKDVCLKKFTNISPKKCKTNYKIFGWGYFSSRYQLFSI